ncbi:MAG: hypothetical protein ACU0A5_23895 [Salipiger marinus]|uniref:hypothetical protein n=1 Tax=Salipiger marinus TaxID=555512 RepID=UPI0040584427
MPHLLTRGELVQTMLRDFDAHRRAIRAHDSEAAEDTWEACEQWVSQLSPTSEANAVVNAVPEEGGVCVMDDLIKTAKDWPASPSSDALSAAAVETLLEGLVNRIEELQGALSEAYAEGKRDALTERVAPTKEAEISSLVPDHCTSIAIAFDPGVLHINKDGSGHIVVGEADFTLEDDRAEGPDGPEGSVHWIARLSESEVVALRDFLNGSAPNITAQDAARLLTNDPQEIEGVMPVMLSRHSVRLPQLDENGNEYFQQVNVPWIVQRQIVADALLALAEGTAAR